MNNTKMKHSHFNNIKKRNDNKNNAQDYEDPRKWFEEIDDDPTDFPNVSEDKLVQLQNEAQNYWQSETSTYNIKNNRTNMDHKWMKTVMAKGTVSDKIAAYTLCILDNPVCQLATLHHLINMTKVSKKHECHIVMDTLSDLFLSDLLRPNVKLKSFATRALAKLDDMASGSAGLRRKLLVLWYFEDQLKQCYSTFVQALNAAAHDSVDANKEKAISTMHRLLAGHPEQEKNLLKYLVNKIGDPSPKVGSKAMYCLSQLLHNHPNMKLPVLNEIERLVFRPNVAIKAQYYSICFLVQFQLCAEDGPVAKHLIQLYFAVFKRCIKQGDIDSRLMAALLTGVNRAYPYAKAELSQIAEHIDTMFRIVHIGTFNVSLYAMNLLHQISEHNNAISDRFYTVLYKKLLDPQLATSTLQALMLHLLFRAMKNDKNTNRQCAFIKRLLQIALNMPAALAISMLLLIEHLIRNNRTMLLLLNVPSAADAKSQTSTYDAHQRNPAFAGTQFAVYDELLTLQQHFHPTVVLYAQKLLNGENISYSGDPLKDFTLQRFLERFSFKNPKKLADVDKLGINPIFGKRKLHLPQGIKSHAVNSKSYLNIDQSKIPVDELFMYIHLQRKLKEEKLAKDDDDDGKDDDSDLESVNSDEFGELLDKMRGRKDFDDDEDLDFMNDVGESLKKTGKDKDEEDDKDESDEHDSDVSFENNDDDNLSDLEDFDDADQSDIEFGSDDELVSEKKVDGKSSKKKNDFNSIFASADEFASLLEADGDYSAGTSNAVSNEDNAHMKQLAWEHKRHRWVRGLNDRRKKKPVTNKRPKKQQTTQTKKKQKTF